MTIGGQTHLRLHMVGVSHVMHMQYTKVKLASLACTGMASVTQRIERSSMSRMNVAIDLEVYLCSHASGRDDRGVYVNKDHVIIKTIFRDDCLSGVVL